MLAEERRVDRDDLHVHALRVHVLQPLLDREAHFGRAEGNAPATARQGAEAFARLVPVAEPLTAGLDRSPQRLGHEVGVDVDGTHARVS
jgi:hypothetical protein